MDWNQLVQWLNEFIKAIQDPQVLIFAVAFLVGLVIDLYLEKIPNWTIPAVNTLIGLISGCILLSTAGFPSHFKGALMGAALALAATGAHQLWEKTSDGIKSLIAKKSTPEVKP